jgi:nucleoside 2-deoxyribosyltransferase
VFGLLSNHAGPRCFISARAGADTRTLRTVLEGMGVQVWAGEALPVSGSIPETLSTAIATADFVLVVVDGAEVAPAVMFEAGAAFGAGRPVLVLDAAEKAVPPSISSLLAAPRISAALDDEEALRYQLRGYIENVLPSASLREPSLDAVDITDVPLAAGPSAGRDSTERTVVALEETGAIVTSMGGGTRHVPDLAASWPQLAPFDPLLVEIAGRKARLNEKKRQLLEFMRSRGARLGLIVTLEERPITEETQVGAAVLVVSLRELELSPSRVLRRLLTCAIDLCMDSSHDAALFCG